MKASRIVAATLLTLSLCVLPAFAGTCSKAELVKAVDQAAALINAKGKSALPELKKFRFCGEEGYVFVVEMNGKNVMHPIQKLEGKDMSMLQGAKGEFFGAEMKAKAEKDGVGWVAYTWENQETKKIETKCSYIKTATMDGVKVFVGAGIFGVPLSDCK
ncbi:MAG TPA: cache domain-containing protein [Deltaproteobacteria bacterium]|nr:cache domain-containing protein [Deltaproteobacteria bacterium]HPR53997.1 cache domain-containing protein [Deltaproteobacteria bacterium]HXK46380.1 cache domain-containing protein [Deltaproteobacteria bacterium]